MYIYISFYFFYSNDIKFKVQLLERAEVLEDFVEKFSFTCGGEGCMKIRRVSVNFDEYKWKNVEVEQWDIFDRELEWKSIGNFVE